MVVICNVDYIDYSPVRQELICYISEELEVSYVKEFWWNHVIKQCPVTVSYDDGRSKVKVSRDRPRWLKGLRVG